MPVNTAERRITIFHRVDDDSHRHQVEDLIEVTTLLHHFFVQTPEMFPACRELCRDVDFGQPAVYLA